MNTTDEPQLSIVVLTYNRACLLRQCLYSLIEQNIEARLVEIVVADDGSTDDTSRVVSEFMRKWPRLVYARQPHKGIPATRNLGILNASAELIAIVADDYVLAPDYVRTILRFFKERPHAAIVRFKIVVYREDIFSRISHFYYEMSFINRLLPPLEAKTSFEKFKFFFKRITPPKPEITSKHDLEAAGAAAFRRSVFERVGLFDETLLRSEDTDYTRRLKALGIPVYYNPFHRVRHQYAWGCLDTLQKNFTHGVNYYRLYRKYAQDSSVCRQMCDAVRELANQFLRSLWRSRQVEHFGEFLLYFPALVAFELAVKAGMGWGLLKSIALRKPPATQTLEIDQKRNR